MKKTWKMRSLSLAACMAMVLGMMSVPNVVKAADGEARINDVSYDTLEAAITAVKSDETITLEKDVTATKALDASKEYTLNLNGKKLTLSTALKVTGSLTLTGNGSMNRTGYGYLIDNSGSLRIENGTYSDDLSNEKEHNGVHNSALIRNLGTLSILDGTFTDDGIVIKNDDVNASKYGTLTINNGTFTGKNTVSFATIQNSGIATINGGSFNGGNATLMSYASTLKPVTTINGGTFTQTATRPLFSNYFYDTTVSSTSEIVVHNGTYNGSFDLTHINSSVKGSVVASVRGGVYDTNVLTGLADGYGCYEKDGTYVVTPVPSGITLSQTSLLMKAGSEEILTATINPDTSAAKAVWSSSDESIATITDGVVKAHAKGTTTISVKAGDQVSKATITVYEVTTPTPPTVDTSKPVKEVTAGVSKDAQATIQNTSDAIIKDVLDGKEHAGIDADTAAAVKVAIQDGKAITTTSIIKNLDVQDVAKADLTKLNSLVNEKAVLAQVLDLQMVLQADGKTLGNITVFEGKLTYTLAIPEALKEEGRTFYVIRLHDGVVEKLSTTRNSDGTLSFETDRLSLYALVYEDKIGTVNDTDKNETPSDTKKEPTTGVNTGDATSLAMPIALMIGSCAIIGIIIVLHKKREFAK